MTAYLLAGGGTAGHVNPLLAVADRLRGRGDGVEIVILGTAEGLESRLVPAAGYDLAVVPRAPFPRRPTREALSFPGRLRAAVARARAVIRDRGIDLVIGFGGYASAPAYIAASRERVPYIVHEANARPGLANIWGARRAAGVATTFPGTRLRGGEVVGMPLRSGIANLDRRALRSEAADHFGLRTDDPVLLVFGGSTGARRINLATAELWPHVVAHGWQVLHATGGDKIDDTPRSEDGRLRIVPYIDRMDLAYALADLVVCRSGASTVSEITALGIPAVYVPYPVGNGEQALNARTAVHAGAAVLIDDAEFTAEHVLRLLRPILTDADARDRMSAAASSVSGRDGTDSLLRMADAVLGVGKTSIV